MHYTLHNIKTTAFLCLYLHIYLAGVLFFSNENTNQQGDSNTLGKVPKRQLQDDSTQSSRACITNCDPELELQNFNTPVYWFLGERIHGHILAHPEDWIWICNWFRAGRSRFGEVNILETFKKLAVVVVVNEEWSCVTTCASCSHCACCIICASCLRVFSVVCGHCCAVLCFVVFLLGLSFPTIPPSFLLCVLAYK